MKARRVGRAHRFSTLFRMKIGFDVNESFLKKTALMSQKRGTLPNRHSERSIVTPAQAGAQNLFKQH